MSPSCNLKPEDIKALAEAAVDSDLFDIDRRLILQGLDRALVSGMTIAEVPLDQFQLDLVFLGRIAPKPGDEAPLVRFLKNAADQLRLRQKLQMEIFDRYAEQYASEAGKQVFPPAGHPASSFVLSGLIPGDDVKFVPIPLALGPARAGHFFLSYGPLAASKIGAAGSIATDKSGLARWLASIRHRWPPIRPPLLTEWETAFPVGAGSKPSLRNPHGLPIGAGDRCFWCVEKSGLVARKYDGRIVDSLSADAWLVYDSRI
jgi:hypothetical protein